VKSQGDGVRVVLDGLIFHERVTDGNPERKEGLRLGNEQTYR